MDPALWPWGISFLGQCKAAAYRRNSDRLLRTSQYSAALLRAISEQEQLEFHRSDLGALYLFSDQRQFQRRLDSLHNDPTAQGILQVLSATELVATEPALAGLSGQLAGGLLSTSDVSGDCRTFALALAGRLETSGNASPALPGPLGARPLIYPVKGYSATYPVLNSAGAPSFAAIDETELVSFARTVIGCA